MILGFLRRERPDYPVLIPASGVTQVASATRRGLFKTRDYLVVVEGAPLRRGLGAWMSLKLKQIILPFYWERSVHVLHVPSAVRDPLTQAVSTALGKAITSFAELPRDAGTDWMNQGVGDTSAFGEEDVPLATSSSDASVIPGATHVSPVPMRWVMASFAAIAVIATVWFGIARFQTTSDPDTTSTVPPPSPAVPSETTVASPASEVTTARPADTSPALSAPIAPAALTPESTTTAAPIRSAPSDDVLREGRANALDAAAAAPPRADPVVETVAPVAPSPSIAQAPVTAEQPTPAPSTVVPPAPLTTPVTTSAPPDAQVGVATRTPPPPVTPEPAAYQGPLAGTLTYSGPPIVQNGEIVFRNLPPVRLALTYDQNVWEARLSPGEGNTQRLIMRNKRPGTQKQCVVTWRVIQ